MAKMKTKFPSVEIDGKRYFLLREDALNEMLEEIEDRHDNRVCDEREKEENISLSELKKALEHV